MTTNRMNPVAWTEGLFLRPQHLQHQDLYFEEQLRHRLSIVDPFHWGVRELEIDEEALLDNRISITHLDAVLPGGTVLQHPGNSVVETREHRVMDERWPGHSLDDEAWRHVKSGLGCWEHCPRDGDGGQSNQAENESHSLFLVHQSLGGTTISILSSCFP